MPPATPTRTRALLAAVCAVCAAGAGWLLVRPVPDDAASGVGRIQAWLQAAGFTHLDAVQAEFLSNVGVFVPLAALAAVLWPRLAWWVPAAGGTAISVLVELIQALFLPQRSASLVDVAANSAGALLGAVLVWAWRADARRRPAPAVPFGSPIPEFRWRLAALACALWITATIPWLAVPVRSLNWLAAHRVPPVLTDIGPWRLALVALLAAGLATLGSLVRPTWSAPAWAALVGAFALVAGTLDGMLLARTATLASVVAAGACGAGVGAWVTRWWRTVAPQLRRSNHTERARA